MRPAGCSGFRTVRASCRECGVEGITEGLRARAVDDPRFSDEILESVYDSLASL
jgi:hypothetical protein